MFSAHQLSKILVAPATESCALAPLVTGTESFAAPWLKDAHQGRRNFEKSFDLSCYFGADLLVAGRGHLYWQNTLLTSPEFMPHYSRNLLELEKGGSQELQQQQSLPVRTISLPCVVLAGHGPAVYGHFLIEMLFRIFIARQALAETDLNPVYLLDSKTPVWLRDILSTYLGIPKEKQLFFDSEKERVQLKQAILPTLASQDGWFHPAARSFLRDFLAQMPLPPYPLAGKRVFISRAFFSNTASVGRSLQNEAELTRLAAQEFGFAPVAIEAFSWPAQLAIFGGSEVVIGAFGSGLHNALFSPENTRIGAFGFLNIVQSQIGALCGHQNGYVMNAPAFRQISSTVSEVDIGAARQFLEAMTT